MQKKQDKPRRHHFPRIHTLLYENENHLQSRNIRPHQLSLTDQGRNHGWKVEGDQVESQHRGAYAPRLAKGRAWCWVREGVAPSAVRVRGITPGKFLKT